MPYRVSFILRCRVNRTGNIAAVLVDVRTGLEYPVVDLDTLPDLIRRLLTKGPPTVTEHTPTSNTPPLCERGERKAGC